MSQQNKTTLQTAINAQIADNTTGEISAADVRDNLINITDSLLFNTGSGQAITGSLIVTEGITGSLQGTASYATQALSASWAPAVASNPFPFTGSAVISGSLNITGSINSTGSVILGRPDFLGNRNLNISFNNEHEAVSLGAGLGINSKTNRISFDTITGTSNITATSSIGLFAPITNIISPTTNITGSLTVTGSQNITGSLTVTGGITSSLLGTASYATQALSASWAPAVASNPFPFTGSAIISGSLGISGSLTLPTIPDVSTGYINMLSYGGIRIRDNDFYEMKLTVDNPSGDSSAVAPGFMVMSGVGGYGINTTVASSTLGETESTINFSGPANSRIQSSQQLILSGSSVNIGRLMTLQPLNPLPSVTNGSIAYSSSGDFYFGSGSAWRKLTL
jgi:phage baseplate assembly protein gpV